MGTGTNLMHDSALDRVVTLYEPSSKSPSGQFVDYLSRPYLILLGDPGMGKTHTFKSSSKHENAKYMTVRSFLATSGMGCDGCILYLDGLDEYRSRSDGNNLIIDLVKSLSGLNLAGFRLSCRAADWLGGTDLELFRAFFDSDNFAVLRLNALVDIEVTTILKASGVQQPQNFVAEAENRGLDALLGNPQTLLMLSDLVSTENWPETRTELFEKSALKLLAEHDANRTRSGLGVFGSTELLLPAGAACSALLISNVSGISLLGETPNQDYPSYRELKLEDKEKINACLTRRAFEQVDPHLEAFSYVHRTIAEFLSAKWIAEKVRCGYPIRRIQNLIGVEGFPTSELRGLHAWVATLLPEHAHLLIKSDPLGVVLYGDAANLDSGARSYLLKCLCVLSKKDPWFRSATNWADAALGSLSGEDMVADFSTILKNNEVGFHLKTLVLSAIKNGPYLPQLKPELLGILTDRNASYSERIDTVDILLGMGSAGASLVVGAYQECLASVKKEVRLRVAILSRLCSSHFDADDVCDVLFDYVNSGNDNSVGDLWFLSDAVPDSDVPSVLNRLSKSPTDFTDDFLGSRHEFSGFVYRLIFKYMTSGRDLTSSRLFSWLVFAHDINRYGQSNVDPRCLSEWLSGCQDRKFQLFESAFQDWNGITGWSWGHGFDGITLGVYSSNEVVDFCLKLVSEDSAITDRHVNIFGICGQYIFAQGHKEYGRFLKWIEVADAAPGFLNERNLTSVCQLDEWRQEESQRNSKNLKKVADSKDAELKNLQATKEMMRSGEHQHNLSVMAEHYFSKMRKGVDATYTISERVGKDLSRYILDGFCATLLMPDLVTAKTISERGARRYKSWYTILAGMDEYFRRNRGISVLPDYALESAFSISVVLPVFERGEGNSSSQITLEWIPEIIAHRPDLAEKCLEILARRELERKCITSAGIHSLQQWVPDCEWRRKLALRLLSDFPGMDQNNLINFIDPLIFVERTFLLELSQVTVFSRGRVKGAQRAIWMAVGYILSPVEFSEPLRTYMVSRPWVLWVIRPLIFYRFNQNQSVTMSATQISFFVELIGSHFDNVSHPLGVTSGDQNSWDASEVVRGLIHQLSAIASEEASAALKYLQRHSALETYSDHITHNLYGQIRLLRESEYYQPDWLETLQALQNSSPVNVSDLHALLLDHLQVIKEEIRHAPTSIFRRFWHRGHRGVLHEPDVEDHCRDHLIDLLKPKLVPLGLRVEPEGHMADDKRADIVVYSSPGGKLPLELKRDFHRDLWTACENQLERLYTCDPEASGYGVYVVFWFGDKRGSSLPKLPEGIEAPCSAVELENSLNLVIQEEKRHRIVAVVLDVESTEKPKDLKNSPNN